MNGGARTWRRSPKANRHAYEGIKALVDRRSEILQETQAQWQPAVKDATSADALPKQTEAARQGMGKAIANFVELSQVEAEVRNNVWKVLQDRMRENLGNLQKLLQPK